jgi:hypothetical protein
VKPVCAREAAVRSDDDGLAALGDRLAGAMAERGHAAAAAALARLTLRPDGGDVTTDLPVLGWLDDALARAAEEVDDAFAATLGAVAPGARWQQTASYVEHPPDASFLDRYAHAVLVQGEDVALGLVLLGPEVHYPLHHHPAEEFYLPAGTVRWTHATDDAPAPEPAGVLVHHAPWQPHALWTDDRPVLLAYVWTGDVRTPAAFC